MVDRSRRKAVSAGLALTCGGIAGCTELFVSTPEPVLIDMQQSLSTEDEGVIIVTVTVENRGGTGEIAVEIRALNDDSEPINTESRIIRIEENETREVTFEIQAPLDTVEIEALAEPA